MQMQLEQTGRCEVVRYSQGVVYKGLIFPIENNTNIQL